MSADRLKIKETSRKATEIVANLEMQFKMQTDSVNAKTLVPLTLSTPKNIDTRIEKISLHQVKQTDIPFNVLDLFKYGFGSTPEKSETGTLTKRDIPVSPNTQDRMAYQSSKRLHSITQPAMSSPTLNTVLVALTIVNYIR